MTGSPVHPGADETLLRSIWAEHRPTMLERVATLRDAASALTARTLDAELHSEATRAAHQLAGAVGTFGFWRASEYAREMESLLEGAETAAVDLGRRLAELASVLSTELDAEPFETSELPEVATAHSVPFVLLVDDDPTLTSRLAEEASRRGMRVEIAGTPAAAMAVAEREQPDLAVLDLTFDDGTDAAYALLTELANRTPAVPVLVLTVRDAFTDRVEVARRGARGFLEKSLSPSDAMDQVAQMLERTDSEGTRVLAVDDDPAVLATTRALLEHQGLEVHTLDDPMGLWEALRRVSPALVLLDVDMPGANGMELCRVLRNDPRWAAIPVLVMTAREDSATIREVFASGADDYLVKPVVPTELVARVENRLERFRLHQALADTDGLTGVANRRTAKGALNQLIRLAERFGRPMCLAELDLDHFKKVNDRYGHATGDAALRRLGELLRRNFRGEDVVARWGGEEFVIGMYGVGRDAGIARVRGLLEVFRAEEFRAGGEHFNLTFSAGVAKYPADGEDLEALYRAADQALYRAKAAGRDQVAGAETIGALPEELVDVAVVEDDEATAMLLVDALAGRGYSTRRFSDGMRAVEALGGPTPVTRAGLVLLDVGVPTLDGFEVLSRLSQEGALHDTRVVMLTGRSGESDVLRALELGAFDHVAKPFSVPVLMQKVIRALER